MVVSSFIKNPKHTKYDGEDKDERILYLLRRSFITNFGWLFTVAILFGLPFIINPYIINMKMHGERTFDWGFIIVFNMFWYLATFGIFFHSFLNWYFNVYIITNKKIVDVDFHGLLYKNISEATLDNIEDVTSTVRGTFGVILNIGDVYVQTAAEQREFEFLQLQEPAKVRDIISDLVQDVRNRKKGHSRYLAEED